VTGQWFSPGPPVSSTNRTDRHHITEILLKVALSTIKQTNEKKHIQLIISGSYGTVVVKLKRWRWQWVNLHVNTWYHRIWLYPYICLHGPHPAQFFSVSLGHFTQSINILINISDKRCYQKTYIGLQLFAFLPQRHNWNIVESGVKHHNPIQPIIIKYNRNVQRNIQSNLY
jgi:hypothetical protein